MNKKITIINVLLLANLASSYLHSSGQDDMQNDLLNAIKQDSSSEIFQSFQSIITKDRENSSPDSILLKAIMTGTSDEIREAVEPILNQGKNNMSPITWAVLLKKPNAIKTLLECGAVINPNIVKYALKMNDPKSILEIVKIGTNISEHMQNYLSFAITHYQREKELSLELILELIKNGYNPNDIWTNSQLYKKRNEELLKFFLENSASPNQRINTYGTPLLAAIYFNNKQAVEILLNSGADINQKGNCNNFVEITPLSLAIEKCNSEIVEFLLERGANL